MKTLLLILVPILLVCFLILFAVVPQISEPFGGAATLASFITVLLTYFYVVLTGMIVVEMIKAQNESLRPFMITDIDFDDREAWFIVKNIGKRPALDVMVSFKPELVSHTSGAISSSFFIEPMKFFPPDKLLRSPLGSYKFMLGDGKPDTYEATISYRWEGHEKVFESYQINIGAYKHIWIAMR